MANNLSETSTSTTYILKLSSKGWTLAYRVFKHYMLRIYFNILHIQTFVSFMIFPFDFLHDSYHVTSLNILIILLFLINYKVSFFSMWWTVLYHKFNIQYLSKLIEAKASIARLLALSIFPGLLLLLIQLILFEPYYSPWLDKIFLFDLLCHTNNILMVYYYNCSMPLLFFLESSSGHLGMRVRYIS